MNADAVLSVVCLAGAGLTLIGSILALRLTDQRRRDRGRREYRLALPRDLDAARLTSFLQTFAGLASPRLGLVGRDSAVLEVVGRGSGLEHRLLLPRASAVYFLDQLRVTFPGIKVAEIEASDTKAQLPRCRTVRELRLSDQTKALAVADPAATARTILSACSGLRGGEAVVWQAIIGGGSPVAPTETPERSIVASLSLLLGGVGGGGSTDDLAPARLRKAAHGLTGAVIRVGAVAATPKRERELGARLLRAAASTAAPGVRLVPRALPGWLVRGRLARRATPLVAWPVPVTPPESVALVGWPIDNPGIPGLVLGRGAQLAPTNLVPRHGRVFGVSTGGKARPVAQSVKASLTHTAVFGPTGAGKSYWLAHLALQAITAGRGLLVLDPKGALVRWLCQRTPLSALNRVVLVDPTDAACPVPLRPETGRGGGLTELAADLIVGLLERRYDLGPRSTDIVLASLYALARVPESTLVDLLPLWTDARFRASVAARVQDDVALRSWFAWYDALSPTERSFVIAPALNKLRPVLARPLVRNVLAAPRSTFSLAEALDDGLIVLIALPEGALGEAATDLLGQIVMAMLWTAIQGRRRRTPFEVIIDEAPRFLHAGVDLGEMLARARGYGVGLTIAAQSLGQYQPEALRNIILNSARSKVAFPTAASDARRLADEFGPFVTPDMLMGLDAFTAMAQVSTGGTVSDAFTFAAPPLGAAEKGRAKAVRAASRARYGVPRAEIEAHIAARTSPPTEGLGPVGRRYDQ